MKNAFPIAAAAVLAGCVAAPPPADEPVQPQVQSRAGAQPAFPERRLEAPTPEAIRGYVEGVVGDRFGPETVRRADQARTSVMAASIRGHFGTGGPQVNVAIREGGGWTGWGGGSRAPLQSAVGAELDRLLASRAFWAEPDRFPASDCPDSGAHLLVVRHQGRTKISRQSCEPANLVGRLLRTVLQEQVPD
jgi:hypothetical protein